MKHDIKTLTSNKMSDSCLVLYSKSRNMKLGIPKKIGFNMGNHLHKEKLP